MNQTTNKFERKKLIINGKIGCESDEGAPKS